MTEADLLVRYSRLAYAAANEFYVPGLDRDDIDQEALIAALYAIRTFNPDAGVLASHIHCCVRRRIMTLMKHHNRAKRHAVVFSIREDDAVDDSMVDHVSNRERIRLALDLVRRMPAKQARAVVGVAAGLTYQELDANPKSVDNALALARAKLSAIPA